MMSCKDVLVLTVRIPSNVTAELIGVSRIKPSSKVVVDYGDGVIKTNSSNIINYSHTYTPVEYDREINVRVVGPIMTFVELHKSTGLTIEHIDASTCSSITNITCENTGASSIILPENSRLERLIAYNCKLTEIDLSKQYKLKVISLTNNKLTSLTFNNHPYLERVELDNNKLTSLTFNNHPYLEYVRAVNNGITGTVDISNCPNLTHFEITRNELDGLDVSKNLILKKLFIGFNNINNIDVSKNTELTHLYCQYNNMTQLDVTKNTKLKELKIGNQDRSLSSNENNKIENIDLSHNPDLDLLWCDFNNLASLDISHNPVLTKFVAFGNPLKIDGVPQKINGIDGFTRKIDYWHVAGIRLNTYDFLPVHGDYDLLNYTFVDDKRDLSFCTDGVVKINASINRTNRYDKFWGSSGISSWSIKAGQVNVHFPDGETTTTKQRFYEKTSEIIAGENLYDYPQLCKMHNPAFGLNETRDNYNIHKILICDSGAGSLWQNGRCVFGIETTCNHISWVPTKHLTSDFDSMVTTVRTFALTIKPGATFYITTLKNSFFEQDTMSRIVFENGVVIYRNKVEVISEETDANSGNITYTLKYNEFPITRKDYQGVYRIYLYLMESTYPDSEDPYETRIVDFRSLGENDFV